MVVSSSFQGVAFIIDRDNVCWAAKAHFYKWACEHGALADQPTAMLEKAFKVSRVEFSKKANDLGFHSNTSDKNGLNNAVLMLHPAYWRKYLAIIHCDDRASSSLVKNLSQAADDLRSAASNQQLSAPTEGASTPAPEQVTLSVLVREVRAMRQEIDRLAKAPPQRVELSPNRFFRAVANAFYAAAKQSENLEAEARSQ